jgi:Tfp pilus assembly protein PilX
MTSAPLPSLPTPSARRRQRGHRAPAARQRGVVLIIALVMLVVVSLLTTLSIRSATSTEKVSGNVRTTELAKQAAEIALRYCEDAVVQVNAGLITLPGTPTILDYQAPPRWKDIANWDVPASDAFLVPKDFVNQATGAATFKREPECMVERIPVVASTGLLSNTSTYVITARGFGPEVAAATAARGRPQGSEVWMQSTIELN